LSIFEREKPVVTTVIITLDYDFGKRALVVAGLLIHNAFVNIGRGQLVTEYESITVIILQTPSKYIRTGTYHFNAATVW